MRTSYNADHLYTLLHDLLHTLSITAETYDIKRERRKNGKPQRNTVFKIDYGQVQLTQRPHNYVTDCLLAYAYC